MCMRRGGLVRGVCQGMFQGSQQRPTSCRVASLPGQLFTDTPGQPAAHLRQVGRHDGATCLTSGNKRHKASKQLVPCMLHHFSKQARQCIRDGAGGSGEPLQGEVVRSPLDWTLLPSHAPVLGS